MKLLSVDGLVVFELGLLQELLELIIRECFLAVGSVDRTEALIKLFKGEDMAVSLKEAVEHFIDLHLLKFFSRLFTGALLLAHGDHHLVIVVVFGDLFFGLGLERSFDFS